MTFFDAIILGVVQGIAEFLPISSSGHLIIARDLLRVTTDHGLAVDALLQLATACAVLVYFRRDIAELVRSVWALLARRTVTEESRTLLFSLVIGTVPAVVAGLYLETYMETVFRSARLVAYVLLVGSAFFLVGEYIASRRARTTLTLGRGALIGVFQTLALVPGFSRSGATIAGGMLLGLSREAAARFSFLLSLPIILGSGLKKLIELSEVALSYTEWYLIGIASLVAFLAGIATIHYLLRFLKEHTLVPFVLYRTALALTVLYLLT